MTCMYTDLLRQIHLFFIKLCVTLYVTEVILCSAFKFPTANITGTMAVQTFEKLLKSAPKN
jgi:hypothetical protein